MIEYFKECFQDIADSYDGEYQVQEESIPGGDGSYIPYSKHCIIVTHGEKKIYFNMEFSGTAVGHVVTEINTRLEDRYFRLKKKEPLLAIFSRNKRSIFVESKDGMVQYKVEEMLKQTGLEQIAADTLFDPVINFNYKGSVTEVELVFSMAFKDKEKAIVPIIEFMKRLIDFLA